MRPLLTVSSPPHIHCGTTVSGIMYTQILALAPAAVMAVWIFGVPALRVMALCATAAVVLEAGARRIMDREADVEDGSALLTGLLTAFLLPASAPWWLALMATATAILLGRQVFGGLGGSPLVPAAVGWAVCRISWPELMNPDFSLLEYSLASPLFDLKHFGPGELEDLDWAALVMGRQIGALGAVQVLPLAVGGLFLLARGVIRVWIPLGFISGLLIAAWLFHVSDPLFNAPAMVHLATGGAVFGAFFLATDFSSSPTGRRAMLVYGLLGGALVMVIRVWGVYTDGTAFAVLLANLLTPLADRIRKRPFGR